MTKKEAMAQIWSAVQDMRAIPALVQKIQEAPDWASCDKELYELTRLMGLADVYETCITGDNFMEFIRVLENRLNCDLCYYD